MTNDDRAVQLRKKLAELGKELDDEQVDAIVEKARKIAANQTLKVSHLREIIRTHLKGMPGGREVMMDNSGLDSVLDDILKGGGSSNNDGKA